MKKLMVLVGVFVACSKEPTNEEKIKAITDRLKNTTDSAEVIKGAEEIAALRAASKGEKPPAKLGDRELFANRVTTSMRFIGFAVTVEYRGDTLIVKGFNECSQKRWDAITSDVIGIGASWATETDKMKEIGLTRLECEDGRGSVVGVPFPK